MQNVKQTTDSSHSSANLEYAQLIDLEQSLHSMLENISKPSADIC